MLTVYKVIYTKPFWTLGDAIAHLTKTIPDTKIDCQETDLCVCFTLKKEEEDTVLVLLPLTETVAVIVKDLCLPQTALFPEEVKSEEEKEEKEVIEEKEEEKA
tara:strand:+ start:995 stop:1303 length:309 start_codon:yes stop_codon:yes gene_type:complete